MAVGHLGVVGMRHRAEQLGGTLAIRSEPDRGSTVELRVPFQGASAPEP